MSLVEVEFVKEINALYERSLKASHSSSNRTSLSSCNAVIHPTESPFQFHLSFDSPYLLNDG